MSDWDFDGQPAARQPQPRAGTGGWDAALTLVSLGGVAAVSFLTAFLTKDILSRPFWLLALCFALPVAALMLAVFLKEKISPAMTPASSRRAQVLLAAASVALAAVVGACCQVSNTTAAVVETVVKNGWDNVLIILDKSGSMYGTRDRDATNAVIDLVRKMPDSAKVGLLIDVGWEENNAPSDQVPLEKRKLAIAPLTAEHRNQLIKLARFETMINENFPCAFDAAYDMLLEYGEEDASILILSDGEDCTGRFLAEDYADKLRDIHVKVNYVYVNDTPSDEMKKLAEDTDGGSLYVAKTGELLENMQTLVSVETVETVYKDALRDIQESNAAKAVTGSLLLLLGILVGVTLTMMLSLRGQKRFQVILSPLMAVLAFLLLCFGQPLLPVAWVREAVAFTLLGLVFMCRNGNYSPASGSPAAAPAGSGFGFPGDMGNDWG